MHKQVYFLVMGVAGCGKSAIASGLAASLHGVYLDADDYHPRLNLERMTSGQPLNDDMRWPWLAAVAEAAQRAHAREDCAVFLACSALKRPYRELLRERLPGLQTIFLEGDEALIHARMTQREGHYMAPGMLKSQLDDLQPPTGEPDVVTVDITPPMNTVLQSILNRLDPAV